MFRGILGNVAEEMWSTLLRFHREVAAPDTMAMLTRFHREVIAPETMATLTRFHREVIAPEMMATLRSFHREVIVPEMMATLIRFHREFALPDVERIVDERITRVDERIDSLRDEMLTHFDGVYQRLDRLETEYHALTAQVRRIEERLDSRTM